MRRSQSPRPRDATLRARLSVYLPVRNARIVQAVRKRSAISDGEAWSLRVIPESRRSGQSVQTRRKCRAFRLLVSQCVTVASANEKTRRADRRTKARPRRRVRGQRHRDISRIAVSRFVANGFAARRRDPLARGRARRIRGVRRPPNENERILPCHDERGSDTQSRRPWRKWRMCRWTRARTTPAPDCGRTTTTTSRCEQVGVCYAHDSRPEIRLPSPGEPGRKPRVPPATASGGTRASPSWRIRRHEFGMLLRDHCDRFSRVPVEFYVSPADARWILRAIAVMAAGRVFQLSLGMGWSWIESDRLGAAWIISQGWIRDETRFGASYVVLLVVLSVGWEEIWFLWVFILLISRGRLRFDGWVWMVYWRTRGSGWIIILRKTTLIGCRKWLMYVIYFQNFWEMILLLILN